MRVLFLVFLIFLNTCASAPVLGKIEDKLMELKQNYEIDQASFTGNTAKLDELIEAHTLNPTILLFRAIEKGDIETVKHLFKPESNQLEEGMSPLIYVASKGFEHENAFEIAKVLLNNKADVNYQDALGNTALIAGLKFASLKFASSVTPEISKQTNFEILNLLVDHPSLNKELKDINGKTALDYVKALDDKEFYIDIFTKLSGIMQEQCAICLDKFEETKEEPTTFGYICPHKFHHACVDRYTHHGKTCPTCRQPEREMWRKIRIKKTLDLLELERSRPAVTRRRSFWERYFAIYPFWAKKKA